MRVSSFSTYDIPVQNIERAVRFYREVFDLPSTFTAHEQSHLSFRGQPLNFIQSTSNTLAITLQIVLQDTPNAIQNHLINYEVPQTSALELKDGSTIFHIADFEGNQIELTTNK